MTKYEFLGTCRRVAFIYNESVCDLSKNICFEILLSENRIEHQSPDKKYFDE